MRQRKYAEGTKVSDDETLRQIKEKLRRAGAEGVLHMDRAGVAVLGFEFDGRAYRFDLPIPEIGEFRLTKTGMLRDGATQTSLWQQEVNRRWRALLDVIEGRLRSVTEGISTVERTFAMEAVMPDGQTVADVILPQIEAAYRTGQMPRLLLPGPGK